MQLSVILVQGELGQKNVIPFSLLQTNNANIQIKNHSFRAWKCHRLWQLLCSAKFSTLITVLCSNFHANEDKVCPKYFKYLIKKYNSIYCVFLYIFSMTSTHHVSHRMYLFDFVAGFVYLFRGGVKYRNILPSIPFCFLVRDIATIT